MAAKVLDGESLAEKIRTELKTRVEKLQNQGVQPGLGTILVGDDEPSARYVKMKHKDCASIGIESFHEHLPADSTQDDIKKVVERFNGNPGVHAYIMQYPFPDHLDYFSILEGVDPAKDADGLHPVNLGRLVLGIPAPISPTPAGIVRLLTENGVEISGKNVVVIGRGITIGRPLSLLLSRKSKDGNAAVTSVHTGVKDITPYTSKADIIIAAAGSPGILKPEMIKPGAAVIAAGISFAPKEVKEGGAGKNEKEGGMSGKKNEQENQSKSQTKNKILSDVADGVEEVAGAISPKVGGVGPMTRALLLQNTVEAAEKIVAESTA